MDTEPIGFARFRLDLGLRELRRDGEPVLLRAQALDIRCALAAAKGEVVGKGDSMALWPGRIVVEEAISISTSRRYARR